MQEQLQQHHTQEQLASAFEVAQKMGYAVAIWKLPFSANPQMVVSFAETLPQKSIHEEHLNNGFLISPFVNPGLEHNYWIAANWYYNVESSNSIDQTTLHHPKAKAFLTAAQQQAASPKNRELKHEIQEVTPVNTKEKYIQMVQKAIREMEEGHFQKVVLSHKKSLQASIAKHSRIF